MNPWLGTEVTRHRHPPPSRKIMLVAASGWLAMIGALLLVLR